MHSLPLMLIAVARLSMPLERSQESGQGEHVLSMPFGQVHTELRNQRIGCRKLCEGKSTQGELAETAEPYAELRNAYDAATELPDRDHAACHNRRSVRPILERDVQQRQPGDRQRRLVLISPSIPVFACGIGRPTLRTSDGLLRDFASTFATGFHIDASPRQDPAAS